MRVNTFVECRQVTQSEQARSRSPLPCKTCGGYGRRNSLTTYAHCRECDEREDAVKVRVVGGE